MSAISIIKMDKNGRTIDPFCWKCHKIGTKVACSRCPKSFHTKCLMNKLLESEESQYVCIECTSIMNCEDANKSSSKSKLSVIEIAELLDFSLNRMMGLVGIEPFMDFVDAEEFPEYPDCIVQPMCLNKLRQNISSHLYKCTYAFVVDCKLILHNSIIFNTAQSKLTTVAKSLMRVCNEETKEIELCPECYRNANIFFTSWFTEVCNPPHVLLWAKLKSFPYWPSKAMAVTNGLVDVRFFGQHDKAWVPIKDCFLYSVHNPNGNLKMKQEEIRRAITELNMHVKNIKFKFLKFEPAALRTPYNPDDQSQFSAMFPAFKLCVEMPKTLKKNITQSSPLATDTVKNIMNDVCSSKMQPKVVLDTSIRNMTVKIKIEDDDVQTKNDSPEKNDSDKNGHSKKSKSLSPKKKLIKIIDKRKRLSNIEIQAPAQMNKNSLKNSEKAKNVVNDNNNSEIMLEYMAALKMCRNNVNNSKNQISIPESPNIDDVKPDISDIGDNDSIDEEKPEFLSKQIDEFLNQSLEIPGEDDDNKYSTELMDNERLNGTTENTTNFEENEYLNKPDENQNPIEIREGETENTTLDKSFPVKKERSLMPKITDVRSQYDITTQDKLKPLIAFSKNTLTNGETGSETQLPSELTSGLKVTPSRKKPRLSSVNLSLSTSLSDSIPIPVSIETDILQTSDVSLTPVTISIPEVNPETDPLSRIEISAVTSSPLPNSLPQIGRAVSLRYNNLSDLSSDVPEDMDFTESDNTSDLLVNDNLRSSQNKKISLPNEITIKRVKKSVTSDNHSLSSMSECSDTAPMVPTAPTLPTLPILSEQSICTNTEVQNDTSKSSETFNEMLEKNSTKLMTTFKNMFLDMVKAESADLLGTNETILSLKIEIEKLKFIHKKEIEGIFYTNGLEEIERMHIFNAEKDEIKREMKWHFNRKIDHIKSKQWCTACKCEAELLCCWVTWYCSSSCQKKHWATHYSKCYNIPRNNQKQVSSDYSDLKFMPKLTSDSRNSKKSDNIPAPTESDKDKDKDKEHQPEDAKGDRNVADE